MKLKLLPAAVAAVLLTPFAAQADTTIYGKMHISLDYFDADLSSNQRDWPNVLDRWPFIEDEFPPTPFGGRDYKIRYPLREASQSAWQVESRATRLGVKGSEDLGGGLKGVYKLEFEIDVDGDAEEDNLVGNRNMYGGLAHGNFGTLLLGRNDTPYKQTFGGWDRFSDTVADDDRIFGAYKGSAGSTPRIGLKFGGRGLVVGRGPSRVTGFSDIRANNSVTYISPTIAGFTVSGATFAGETNEDDGLSSGGWSVGALGQWGGLKVSLGYEELSLSDYSAPFWGSVLEDDDTKWGAGIAWDRNPFYVGVRYEDRENVGGLKGLDVTQYQIAGEFSFGNNTVKALYQSLGSDMPWHMSYLDWEADAWAIGVDHSFSKRTAVYLLYTSSEHQIDTPFGLPLFLTDTFVGDRVNTAEGDGREFFLPAATTAPARDVDAFSIGITHSF